MTIEHCSGVVRRRSVTTLGEKIGCIVYGVRRQERFPWTSMEPKALHNMGI